MRIIIFYLLIVFSLSLTIKKSFIDQLQENVDIYFKNMNKFYTKFEEISKQAKTNVEMRFKEKENPVDFNKSKLIKEEDNLENLVDKDFQHKIKENFVNTIKSKKFVKQIEEQNKYYQDKRYRETIEDIGEFNQKERELAINDKHAIQESEKLQKAIFGLTRKFYKMNINKDMSDKGSEFTKFVHKEATLADKMFNSPEFKKEYNMKDIENMIKLNNKIN